MKNSILTILLLLPTILLAQIDRSIRPVPTEAPIININDSEIFKLDNGLTIILSENHKLPKVTFKLVTGAKPNLEGAKAGLSEIAGSLIMSGTTNKSKDELDREIDYIGARLSATKNSLYLSCLTKHMDKGLSLMSDILMNSNFPKSEVERIIKKNESNLIALKSDANSIAENVQSIANFPGHPYGEVMTSSSLKNINQENIIKYYKENFVPEGAYLVVVGDITKEKVLSISSKYFGKWSGNLKNETELSNISLPEGNRVIFVKKPGAVQSVIKITFPIEIKPNNEDYLKLKVLNNVLGGGSFGNRLMQNLREDKAFTYGCRSRINVTENGSWFSAGGNFRNEVTDSAIHEILYELKNITNELVTDEEINLTKSSMAGGFARSLERASTIASFALDIIKNNLPANYYKNYLKELASITKDDLLDVAKKYFNDTKCNIIVVGNEDVLNTLQVFDFDGEIEKLDAFGNQVKDIIQSDITKEELLRKYLNAVTSTSSEKELLKKIKKIKSMEQVSELEMSQMPMTIKSTKLWVAPNSQGDRLEGGGMVFQSSYFDGSKGYTQNIQTGKKEMTEEEIQSKKLAYGIFPEINYSKTRINYELLGIETKGNKLVYVLKIEDGISETYDYFDKESFLKTGSLSIRKVKDKSEETSITYSNYQETNGLMFPMTYSFNAGKLNLKGKVTSIKFNVKNDFSEFK